MKEVTETDDPKVVLEFLNTYEDTIPKSQKYVSIALCIVKRYQNDIDINKKSLDLIKKYIDANSSSKSGAENSVKFLLKEGMMQLIENAHNFFDYNENFVSELFDLICLTTKNKEAWVDFLLGNRVKEKIFESTLFLMTPHKNNAEICDKCTEVLLSVFECCKDTQELQKNGEMIQLSLQSSSDLFFLYEGLTPVMYLLNNASKNQGCLVKIVKLLSLLSPTDGILESKNEILKEVIKGLFSGLNNFVSYNNSGQPSQNFIGEENVHHVFNFLSMATFKSSLIREYFIKKDYLVAIVKTMKALNHSEEALLCGSKIIRNFMYVTLDVKKAAMSKIVDELCSMLVNLKASNKVYMVFFNIFYLVVKDCEEYSRKAIEFSVDKKIIEVVKASPGNMDLQKSGIKTYLEIITRSESDASSANCKNIEPIVGLLKTFPKEDDVKVYCAMLLDNLNNVSLDRENKGIIIDMLECGIKHCPDKNAEFRKAFKEFEEMYHEYPQINSDDEIGLFTKSLETFVNDPIIISSCIAILTELINKELYLLSSFERYEGIKLILNVMRKYEKDVKMLESACKLFALITASKRRTSKVFSGECIKEIVKAMENISTSKDLQRYGAHALANYAKTGICMDALGERNIIWTMGKILKDYLDDPETQKICCVYFSNMPHSEAGFKVLVELETYKILLGLLKSENPDLQEASFLGFCNIVMLFGIIDIPSEKSLGVSQILGFISKNKQEPVYVKKGLDAILKILRFKPSAQEEIDKNFFVGFVLEFSVGHVNDPEVVSVSKDIFSVMEFVQGKDKIENDAIEKIVKSLVRQGQTEAVLEEYFVLLIKFTVFEDFVVSPQMKSIIKSVVNIISKNSYKILQRYCFEVLAIASGVQSMQDVIRKANIVLKIPIEVFQSNGCVEYVFTLLLNMEKSFPYLKVYVYEKYIKHIFCVISRPGTTKKTKSLGYDIVYDLSMHFPDKKVVDKESLFYALKFICENFEDDTTFSKASVMLRLAYVNNKKNPVLAKIIKDMLFVRDNRNAQISGCKKIKEAIEREKCDVSSTGVIETLFIIMLIHRNNNRVINELCKTLRYIHELCGLKFPKVKEKIANLRFDTILISLLKVHRNSGETIKEICKTISSVMNFVEIDEEKAKAYIPQEFLVKQSVEALKEALDFSMPHDYQNVINIYKYARPHSKPFFRIDHSNLTQPKLLPLRGKHAHL